jgi:cytochrome P450
MLLYLVLTPLVLYLAHTTYQFIKFFSFPHHLSSYPHVSTWNYIKCWIRSDPYETMWRTYLQPHFNAQKHIALLSAFGWTLQMATRSAAKYISVHHQQFNRITFHTLGLSDGLAAHFFGTSIALSDGESWYRQRKLLNDAFHGLRPMRAVETAGTHLVRELQSQLGKPILVIEQVRKTLFRSLLMAVFGLPELMENGQDEQFCTMMTTILEATTHPFYMVFGFLDRPWFPPRRPVFQMIEDYDGLVRAAVLKKRQQLVESGKDLDKKNLDFTSLMLLANEDPENEHMRLTDLELVTNCKGLFITGTDTTTTALSATLFLLAKHPEVQEKARQEVVQVMGRTGQAPTEQQQKELVYVNAILREAQRMYPASAQTIERYAVEDVTFPDGTFLPKGGNVAINIWALCYDPQVWSEPDTFRPERHLGDNREGREPYDFFGFGAGKRICPGMNFATLEMRVILSMLLQTYSWRLAPGCTQFTTKNPFYMLCPVGLELVFEAM